MNELLVLFSFPLIALSVIRYPQLFLLVLYALTYFSAVQNQDLFLSSGDFVVNQYFFNNFDYGDSTVKLYMNAYPVLSEWVDSYYFLVGLWAIIPVMLVYLTVEIIDLSFKSRNLSNWHLAFRSILSWIVFIFTTRGFFGYIPFFASATIPSAHILFQSLSISLLAIPISRRYFYNFNLFTDRFSFFALISLIMFHPSTLIIVVLFYISKYFTPVFYSLRFAHLGIIPANAFLSIVLLLAVFGVYVNWPLFALLYYDDSSTLSFSMGVTGGADVYFIYLSLAVSLATFLIILLNPKSIYSSQSIYKQFSSIECSSSKLGSRRKTLLKTFAHQILKKGYSLAVVYILNGFAIYLIYIAGEPGLAFRLGYFNYLMMLPVAFFSISLILNKTPN